MLYCVALVVWYREPGAPSRSFRHPMGDPVAVDSSDGCVSLSPVCVCVCVCIVVSLRLSQPSYYARCQPQEVQAPTTPLLPHMASCCSAARLETYSATRRCWQAYGGPAGRWWVWAGAGAYMPKPNKIGPSIGSRGRRRGMGRGAWTDA